jgi:5-methylcytosine-specific restriction endonuclease McrA
VTSCAPKPYSTLRLVSEKKARKDAEFERISKRIRSERPACEGPGLYLPALHGEHLTDAEVDRLEEALRGCRGRSSHAHHIVQRAVGGTDEDSNLLSLCWACHDFAHREIPLTYRIGLLKPGGSE